MEKYRTLIWHTFLFLAGWAFYFILGYDLVHLHEITTRNDLILGMDTGRTTRDLLIPERGHTRTTVHALFVILFQPLGRLVATELDSGSAVLFLMSGVASLSVILLHACLVRIVPDRLCRLSLTALYFFSMSQLLYGSLPETYIVAGCTLIAMHYCFMLARDKPMKMPLKITLGIMALAITITNYVQFLILLFADALPGHSKKRWLGCIAAVAGSLAIAAMLAAWQKQIYPTSNPFYLYILNPTPDMQYTYLGSRTVKDILEPEEDAPAWDSLSEEIRKTLGIVFQGTMIRGWIFTGWELVDKDPRPAVEFTETAPWQWAFGTVTTTLLVVLGGLALRRREKFPLLVPVIACLMFNLVLHIFYNHYESHLYTQHFLFLMIFIMAYGLAAMESGRLRRLVAGLIFVLAMIEGGSNLLNYAQIQQTLLSYYQEQAA